MMSTIGVVVGIEGSGLLAEQNRRLAQIEAERLQEKARGEIFDQLFRGFPADVLDIKVRDIRLSDSDLNVLEIRIEYSYKPSFIKALESTVKALALVKCKDGPWRSVEGARNALLYDVCRKLSQDRSQDNVVCLGFSSKIECYALPPGDYCASCRLNELRYGAVSLVMLGRFVDSTTQSANRSVNCIGFIATPDSQQQRGILLQAYIKRATQIVLIPDVPDKKVFYAWFNFDKQDAIIKVSTSLVDLNKAKYFIAVSAIKPDGSASSDTGGITNYTALKNWINSIVPDVTKPANGCDLLDEAVQRHFLEQPPQSQSQATQAPKSIEERYRDRCAALMEQFRIRFEEVDVYLIKNRDDEPEFGKTWNEIFSRLKDEFRAESKDCANKIRGWSPPEDYAAKVFRNQCDLSLNSIIRKINTHRAAAVPVVPPSRFEAWKKKGENLSQAYKGWEVYCKREVPGYQPPQ
jgi:hypothetical protein